MNPALLLIDLQGDFLDAPGLEPTAGQIVDRASALLQGCRSLRIPVFHIRIEVSPGDDRRMPHWKAAGRWSCVKGTPGHATPEILRPADGEEVIPKTSFSPFLNPRLETALRELNCDHVLLAGVHLHACIRQTALDAYQRGFGVRIAADATGSDDPLHAAVTRRYLADRGMTFEDVDSLLSQLAEGKLTQPAVRDAAEAVDQAVRLARSKFSGWAGEPSGKRSAILEHLAALLRRQAPALAESIARELGKPIRFARTEILRSAEMLHAIIRRAGAPPLEPPHEHFTTRCAPHGVVALITPWNNPVYIPLGKLAPAVLYGNTVVWKPSPFADAISRQIQDALISAGMPPGVVNLLLGGSGVADRLMRHPDVNAVSLTGSSAAGHAAQDACSRRRAPLQAELGGNNAAIVWPDADLPVAARKIAEGAFAMAGQRCTANRRVIVHESCASEFLDLLVTATASLRWGDPLDESTVIGPLVSASHARRVATLVDRAKADAALVLVPHGSSAAPAPGFAGAWHAPTIVCCDRPSAEIVQEETFGPVLVIQRASGWEDALALCNGVRQGLVASLFTRSPGLAREFLTTTQAGILKVNESTADAAVDTPFGGWKASGIGPPEHAQFDRQFYTRPQTHYDFSS